MTLRKMLWSPSDTSPNPEPDPTPSEFDVSVQHHWNSYSDEKAVISLYDMHKYT